MNTNAYTPMMTFGEVILYYDNYARECKKCGIKPVSFFRFIFGRY